MTLSVVLRTLILTGAIFLAGCSTIRTRTPEGDAVTMNEAEFAAYVEHVFRHHNNVVNDLMFASSTIEDKDGNADAELVGAETRMDYACLPLNELVSALAGGQKPGFRTKMQLVKAVPECEAATRKVETLISSGF
jgi:uncharacterized protein YceK